MAINPDQSQNNPEKAALAESKLVQPQKTQICPLIGKRREPLIEKNLYSAIDPRDRFHGLSAPTL
jgi:hypothetical protein